jgi:hypothetical protein
MGDTSLVIEASGAEEQNSLLSYIETEGPTPEVVQPTSNWYAGKMEE